MGKGSHHRTRGKRGHVELMNDCRGRKVYGIGGDFSRKHYHASKLHFEQNNAPL